MSGRRNSGGSEHGEEAWLLPYADMITLLLGLFIVLFALSSIDVAKFDSVSKAFSQTFRGSLLQSPGNITTGSAGVLSESATSANTQKAITVAQSIASNQTKERFDKEQEKLKSMAQKMQGDMKGQVNVREDDRGLVLSVAGDALFESGRWDVRASALPALKAIAANLSKFGSELEIEGHTDGAPYPGEWGNQGLSSNRALSVWKIFVDSGVLKSRMSTVGKGAEVPLVKPTTPTASMPKNRRVEIHILAPGKSAGTFESKSSIEAKKSPNKSSSKSPQKRILSSAINDHITAKKPEKLTTNSKPSADIDTSWGGVSTSSDDIVNPIVDAS